MNKHPLLLLIHQKMFFGFDPLYFKGSGNQVLGIVPSTSTDPSKQYELSVSSNGSLGPFKLSDTGILTDNNISFNDTIKNQDRNTGTYVIDNPTITKGNGSGATFQVVVTSEVIPLNVSNSVLANIVSEVSVINNGENFSTGDTLTINDTDIGASISGTNLTITIIGSTEEKIYTMTSYPIDTSGNYLSVPDSEGSNSIKSSGFQIQGTVEKQ